MPLLHASTLTQRAATSGARHPAWHPACTASKAGRRSSRAMTIASAQPSRRTLLAVPLVLAPLLGSTAPSQAVDPGKLLDTMTPMDALKDKDYGKSRLKYPDFTATPSGLQYKDFREGSGEAPKKGETVVIDWDGYTIGYYGRPFEARNKPKGSSFTGENKDYVRFVLGSGSVIPAFEEALVSMKVGGIRRIIVPEEIGYPTDNWRSKGPQPSTFAGDRALGFVMENRGMIDKTLLFDIELKNILRSN